MRVVLTQVEGRPDRHRARLQPLDVAVGDIQRSGYGGHYTYCATWLLSRNALRWLPTMEAARVELEGYCLAHPGEVAELVREAREMRARLLDPARVEPVGPVLEPQAVLL